MGHLAGIELLEFSPDSRTLATASSDHSIRLWHVETGQELVVARAGNDWFTGAKGTIFAPDGTCLVEAAGESGLRFIPLPTLAEIDAAEKAQAAAMSVPASAK